MSKRDLALRLLLALVFILNGIAPVMAGAPHDQAPPCHGEHAMADMPQPSAPLHPAPAPDCCEAGQCTCACMQPAQAPTPAPVAQPMAVPAPGVRALVLGHPSPALPHPIRPPIG